MYQEIIMQTPNIVEITLDNFQQVILEESKEKLILVAFWAEQVPESVELKNKLAAAVHGFDEHIVLATVDCQAQQQIAMQFGVQGLPTAVIVKDGQPIDGVSGPQTDETIQQLLAKYLPKAEDNLLKQAKNFLAEGNANAAYTQALQAYQLDNERADIKLVLAESCLAIGKIDEAKNYLQSIKLVDQDSDYKALIAKLELAEEAADSPEIKVLEQALLENPDDIETLHKLAAQYSQVNRFKDALAVLFKQVQKEPSDAESKRLLLDVLKSLPEGDPLASQYRRKLYTLLY
jgi:putative thioredoxin